MAQSTTHEVAAILQATHKRMVLLERKYSLSAVFGVLKSIRMGANEVSRQGVE